MYPEIINIQNFIAAKGITIWLGKGVCIDEKLTPIKLVIDRTKYIVYILDEYEDLNYFNPLLNFVVVFRALAIINDSEDYLVWCKQLGLNANNPKLLNYYQDICNTVHHIENCFPNNEIDYFVSDLDFQLNFGIMQFLRL